MFTFLLIVQALIGAALVGTILMQRSEGGGLGVGGSSSGFMTARGAADFLTRATAILGGVFILLCIVLAAIAGVSENATVDTSLANQAAPVAPAQSGIPPLVNPNQPGAVPADAAPQPPAGDAVDGAVPLAQ
ncbi:MAG: preprotein translocase subunit SecG [Pseudomonadota bacterium]|nr:preprotein translocase subunit SecG [Pseudomonadota bacterium]